MGPGTASCGAGSVMPGGASGSVRSSGLPRLPCPRRRGLLVVQGEECAGVGGLEGTLWAGAGGCTEGSSLAARELPPLLAPNAVSAATACSSAVGDAERAFFWTVVLPPACCALRFFRELPCRGCLRRGALVADTSVIWLGGGAALLAELPDLWPAGWPASRFLPSTLLCSCLCSASASGGGASDSCAPPVAVPCWSCSCRRALKASAFLRRCLCLARLSLQLRRSPSNASTSWKRPHCTRQGLAGMG